MFGIYEPMILESKNVPHVSSNSYVPSLKALFCLFFLQDFFLPQIVPSEFLEERSYKNTAIANTLLPGTYRYMCIMNNYLDPGHGAFSPAVSSGASRGLPCTSRRKWGPWPDSVAHALGVHSRGI